MNSKTSFINAGILRHDFKALGWMGVAYLLGLLLSVPLQIVMIHSQQKSASIIYDALTNPYLRIFQFDSGLQMVLLLTVPVLAALLLFRYLHSGKAVDLIHSLPVRRETLYNTHLTAGIILLFVPVILTALVSWAVFQGLGIDLVSTRQIFTWLGVALVYNLLLFISGAAVGMLSGMSTVQGALTYILLLLPAGLSALALQNLQLYIFGLPYDFLGNNLDRLSPLLRITQPSSFSGLEIAIYLLCCLALYLVGLFLYRRRPMENAGSAIAFRQLHPVLVYGVTFCGMLLLGAYFHATLNSMSWTCFGYFLGSILGYILSMVLINKSLSIFNLPVMRNYLLYSLVTVILIGALNYDIIGYEKRIPPMSEVKSVYMDSGFSRLHPRQVSAFYATTSVDDNYERRVTMVYTDPDNIAAIHQLHQTIIDNRKTEKKLLYSNDESNSYSYRNYCLAYHLRDGRTVYRQYRAPLERYAAYIKPVYESQEHKKMAYDILNISPLQVDLLLLSANEINRSVRFTDPVLIKLAVNALQFDARSQTYEEMILHNPSWAEITLLLNNGKRLHLSWEKSYAYFENWLKEAGEYDNARVMPADIKYALVQKTGQDSRALDRYRGSQSEEYVLDLEKKGGCLRITDPEQIEVLLRSYTYQDYDGTYQIYFVTRSGVFFSGGLSNQQGYALLASL